MPKQSRSEESTSRLQVLLVERDTLLREGMAALLRAWNFEVIAVAEPGADGAADGTAAPKLAIIGAPLGNPALGVEWIGHVHAGYGRLPTILIADGAADATASSDWLRIDWPVQTRRLRDAIATLAPTDRRRQ